MIRIFTATKIFLIISFFVFGTTCSLAQDNSNYSFGISGGMSDNNYNMKFSNFQTDINYILLDNFSINGKIYLQFGVDVNVGVIETYKKIGLVLSAGPKINVNFRNSRFSLFISSMPTYLSRDIYQNFSLGGRFHFLSRVGCTYRVADQFGFEYSFEHISNGGIVKPNPGLNFHMIGLRIYSLE